MIEQDGPTQAEGLLDQIADTALDDDYYVVRTGTDQQSREFNTVLTAVVLAVFALLVTIAVVQTRNDRPATERERQTLVRDVESRKSLLESRQATAQLLGKEVEGLSASVNRFDPDYEDLRLITADRSARGPGISVRVAPAPEGSDAGRITDNDLQLLVNGLWYAGAEAVSVNGQRLGTLSSIRTAGPGITVNYVSTGAPYTVVALGNEETLEQRFADNDAGRYWARRSENTGVEFDVTPSSELSVGAAPTKRLTLSHAKAFKGEE